MIGVSPLGWFLGLGDFGVKKRQDLRWNLKRDNLEKEKESFAKWRRTKLEKCKMSSLFTLSNFRFRSLNVDRPFLLRQVVKAYTKGRKLWREVRA